MSSIGPELPPHLVARRKRHAEEERGEGEAASPTSGRSSSPDGAKRQRVVGPSLPPAPLDERPNTISASHGDSNSEGDDDDDDGYGPAPPPPNGSVHDAGSTLPPPTSEPVPVSTQPSKAQPERDAWMMMPPKQDDLAARMDPLKIRARKFNTGKGPHRAAPGSGNSDSTLWTETPEQKRKRLEDEVLGVTAPKTAEPAAAQVTGRTSKEERETARLIKEHAEKTRGKSLYVQHQKSNTQEPEDDPSQRPFDREKDIGGGLKIGHAQRKEMLSRASDFGSRFAGGGFL